ncbi:MAG TPA: hypothetical protein VD994_00050 [Prosthecobacter sp.]|nr:hypothetical protein [Prosthecobacter sp.]
MSHVVAHAGEQKGAQLAPLRIDGGEDVLVQQASEEALVEIFRIRRGPAAAADEGVERVPISRTQLFQSLPRLIRLLPGRLPHEAPAGGVE